MNAVVILEMNTSSLQMAENRARDEWRRLKEDPTAELPESTSIELSRNLDQSDHRFGARVFIYHEEPPPWVRAMSPVGVVR